MKKIFLSLVLISLVAISFAENNKNKSEVNTSNEAAVVNLSGTITDVKTGESLAGVEVCLKGTELKTYTDFDGNFSFKNLKKGNYDIVSTYISYKKELVENVKLSQTKNQVEIKLKASN